MGLGRVGETVPVKVFAIRSKGIKGGLVWVGVLSSGEASMVLAGAGMFMPWPSLLGSMIFLLWQAA